MVAWRDLRASKVSCIEFTDNHKNIHIQPFSLGQMPRNLHRTWSWLWYLYLDFDFTEHRVTLYIFRSTAISDCDSSRLIVLFIQLRRSPTSGLWRLQSNAWVEHPQVSSHSVDLRQFRLPSSLFYPECRLSFLFRYQSLILPLWLLEPVAWDTSTSPYLPLRFLPFSMTLNIQRLYDVFAQLFIPMCLSHAAYPHSSYNNIYSRIYYAVGC